MIRLPLVGRRPKAVAAWRANPFLHLEEGRVYDPFAHRYLTAHDPGYPELRRLAEDGGRVESLSRELDPLAGDGWLVPAEDDLSRRFRLRYVSVETHSVCNQKCYFCPVATAPRPSFQMPTELWRSIVGQLTAWSDTIEAVVLNNYNEPTVDPRFVDQVRELRASALPPAVLTNGSTFTPDKVDGVLGAGGLVYLSVNISTLDRERYRRDRGKDHLPRVLDHIDYMKDKPLADTMDLVVLGHEDEAHEREVAAMRERFAGSRFEVKPFAIMDRAGWLELGLKPDAPHRRLCGCENTGSRPLQHLHVTAEGKVVFCCEDYDEVHVVGDLNESTVEEVLTGPEIAKLRRWSYGVEQAPDDFMCRNCVFALHR